MYFRKVYNAPIAERFAIEEDCRLLENSFKQEEGSEEDWGEAKPITGGITLEDDNENMNSSQILHD